MQNIDRIFVKLTFLSKSEGGRDYPPYPPWSTPECIGDMPHLVVEGCKEYLGVRFIDGPQPICGEPAMYEVEPMYTGVDYSMLTPGVAITVREGGRIVAYGRVSIFPPMRDSH